jgi:hypothetical protein
MIYVNDIGAVVREYVPGASVPGTHVNVIASASCTIGFVVKRAAEGAGGKAKRSVSHIKLGHQDFSVSTNKRQLTNYYPATNAYKNWIASNLIPGVKGGLGGTFQNYYTIQHNSYYQRRYGQ